MLPNILRISSNVKCVNGYLETTTQTGIVSQYRLGLGARIGVAMDHSSWVRYNLYSVVGFMDPMLGLYVIMIPPRLYALDEELREFTSEYYIPSALHPVVPAADASIADFPVGKVGNGEEPLLESTAGAQWNSCWSNRNSQQALALQKDADVAEVVMVEAHEGYGDDGAGPSNVEATSDSSAPVTHAAQSPPQTGPKAFDGMPVDQLVEEFDTVTAQQAALVAQLRARFANERSQSIQKDEEILLLKAQLEFSQVRQSLRGLMHSTSRGKNGKLVKVEMSKRLLRNYKASCLLAVKYLEGGKNKDIFAGWDDFRTKVEGLWRSRWISFASSVSCDDEELFVVRWVFGDVVKCALARGKAEAVEELHERRLLTVPAAQACLPEGAEAQPDYFLKPDVSQLQVPIFASPRDILNPFALEKEVPLKESLEAHAIRLAKKKGVKGKAILCGVGAAHTPVRMSTVRVATVSPKDCESWGSWRRLGMRPFLVGRSEQCRLSQHLGIQIGTQCIPENLFTDSCGLWRTAFAQYSFGEVVYGPIRNSFLPLQRGRPAYVGYPIVEWLVRC
ncbi:hypothetical protein Tco_0587993 [Tanacetum coccineum]